MVTPGGVLLALMAVCCAVPVVARAQPVEVPLWIDGAPCIGVVYGLMDESDTRRVHFRRDGRPLRPIRYHSGFGDAGAGWCAVLPPPSDPGSHTVEVDGLGRIDWLEAGAIAAGEERCFSSRASRPVYPIEGLVDRASGGHFCVTPPWTSTERDEVNATLRAPPDWWGDDEPRTFSVLRARVEGAPVRLAVWHLVWILITAVAIARARRGRPRATWVVSFVPPDSVTFRDRAAADWTIERLEHAARALGQSGLRLTKRFGVEGILAPQPVMWTDDSGRPRRSRFVPLIAGGGLHDGTKPMLFFDDASAAEIRAGRVVLTLPTPEALGVLQTRAPRREPWPSLGFFPALALSVGTAALLTHLIAEVSVYTARTLSGMAIAAAFNVMVIAVAMVAIRPDPVRDPLAAWRRDRI